MSTPRILRALVSAAAAVALLSACAGVDLSALATPTPTPTMTPTVEAAEAPDDAAADQLATDVAAAIDAELGSLDEACGRGEAEWACVITAITPDSDKGVTVETTLADDGDGSFSLARDVAQGVMQLSCTQVDGLREVLVVTASGEFLTRYYSSESPVCS